MQARSLERERRRRLSVRSRSAVSVRTQSGRPLAREAFVSVQMPSSGFNSGAYGGKDSSRRRQTRWQRARMSGPWWIRPLSQRMMTGPRR